MKREKNGKEGKTIEKRERERERERKRERERERVRERSKIEKKEKNSINFYDQYIYMYI